VKRSLVLSLCCVMLLLHVVFHNHHYHHHHINNIVGRSLALCIAGAGILGCIDKQALEGTAKHQRKAARKARSKKDEDQEGECHLNIA